MVGKFLRAACSSVTHRNFNFTLGAGGSGEGQQLRGAIKRYHSLKLAIQENYCCLLLQARNLLNSGFYGINRRLRCVDCLRLKGQCVNS